jgi:hypothetical protein
MSDPSVPEPATLDFEGHEPRRCGEHRTVGHRAWCHDCREWCYPEDGCANCKPDVDDVMEEVDRLSAELDAAHAQLRRQAAELAELRAGRVPGATAGRLMGPMTRRIGQLGIALRRLVEAIERDDGVDMTPLWERAREVLADNSIIADAVDRSAHLDELVRHAQEHGLYEATAEPVDTRPLSFDESMDVIKRRYGDTIRSEAFDDEPAPVDDTGPGDTPEPPELDPDEVREWLKDAAERRDLPSVPDDPERLAERIRGLKATVLLRRLVKRHDEGLDHMSLPPQRALWAEARALLLGGES